jgi:hypothetical protein
MIYQIIKFFCFILCDITAFAIRCKFLETGTFLSRLIGGIIFVIELELFYGLYSWMWRKEEKE